MTRDDRRALAGTVCFVLLLIFVGFGTYSCVRIRQLDSQNLIDQCLAEGGFPIVGGRSGRYRGCYFGEDTP